MKKLFSLLLSLLLLFGIIPANTQAVVQKSFHDIENHWAKDSILWGCEQGLINGVSDEAFSPNSFMNRAMAVTMLYRYDKVFGSQEDDLSLPEVDFIDVPVGSYYYEAVQWGVGHGIIKGTSNDLFSPAQLVTRQDFATMLFRYNNAVLNIYQDVKFMWFNTFDKSVVSDTDDVSEYAAGGVRWANYNKIITANSKREVLPQAKLTRAQAITALHKYYNYRKVDNPLFSVNPEDVKQITVSAGSTGYSSVQVSLKQDIAEFVELLNSYEYRAKENNPFWALHHYTYLVEFMDPAQAPLRVLIDSYDSEEYVRVGSVGYYGTTPVHFTSDWAEKCFEKYVVLE